MIDYQIVLIDLPSCTREAVTPNEDGSYTIFIADWLSKEQQKKTFLHAMRHICNNDFGRVDVDVVEWENH